MYSRDLKLIKKFYIVTKLDILTSNYFKHKNIAVIINLKNQPDSSIIRKIVKKNIYNKIFVSNNTKLITNKKIQLFIILKLKKVLLGCLFMMPSKLKVLKKLLF